MNDISILQPMTQVDKDKELLLELLKESRSLLMKRVAEQARKIVELTVSRNALMAEVDGIGNVAKMKEHIADMKENAKKLAAEIKSLNEQIDARVQDNYTLVEKNCELTKALEHRTADIEALQKSLEQAVAEKEKLQQELNEKKKQCKGEVAKNTSMKIMVDYAKAQGMTFPRLDAMKAFINQNSNEDSVTAADAMAQMAKEADNFFKAADDFVAKQKASKGQQGQSTGAYICPDNKSEVLINHECPYNAIQDNGKTAYAGGRYCVKKCPYFDSIDRDQEIVYCTKNK